MNTICVRPAWGPDSPPLSERAARLLVAEWVELGLVDPADEGDPAEVLRGVQSRAGTTTRSGGPQLKLVTTADDGPADAPPADWPTFEGTLLTYGETAHIGRDPDGHYVTERFKPGALSMPEQDTPVLLNRFHDRPRTVGHLTGLSTVGEAVQVRGLLVDSIQDGHEAVELARAGTVTALSVEFVSLGPPYTTITRQAGGGQLVEHSKVLLVGVALVPQPAYGSARLLRLLDRRETGRQRQAVRHQAMAGLRADQARARATDARIRALKALGA